MKLEELKAGSTIYYVGDKIYNDVSVRKCLDEDRECLIVGVRVIGVGPINIGFDVIRKKDLPKYLNRAVTSHFLEYKDIHKNYVLNTDEEKEKALAYKAELEKSLDAMKKRIEELSSMLEEMENR